MYKKSHCVLIPALVLLAIDGCTLSPLRLKATHLTVCGHSNRLLHYLDICASAGRFEYIPYVNGVDIRVLRDHNVHKRLLYEYVPYFSSCCGMITYSLTRVPQLP